MKELFKALSTIEKKLKSSTFSYANENVDINYCSDMYQFFSAEVIDYCKKCNNFNYITLFVGGALNLYYTSGLFERLGRFDINIITSLFDDEDLKKYISLEEEYSFYRLTHYYLTMISAFTSVEKYAEELKGELNLKDILFRLADVIKNDTYFKTNSYTTSPITRFKDLCMMQAMPNRFEDIKDYLNDKNWRISLHENYIDRMLEVNSTYYYANIYKYIGLICNYFYSKENDQTDNYKNNLNEENLKFIQYSEKLDQNLVDYILGMNFNDTINDDKAKFKLPKGIDKTDMENDNCTEEQLSELKLAFEKYSEDFRNKNILMPKNIGIPRIDFDYIIPNVEIGNWRLLPHNSIANDFCTPTTITVKPNAMKYMYELINSYKFEVEKKLKKELEINEISMQAAKEKEDIIQTFSHRYKNMKANTLYNIAQTLIESDDEKLQHDGATLLVEYGIKQNLTTEVLLLEMMFNDELSKVKNKICKSIKILENSTYIEKLVSEILKKHLISSYFDDNDILSYGFDMIEDSEIDDSYGKFWDAEESFKKDVLFNPNTSCIDWFTKKITKFNHNIDDSSLWNYLECDTNGFAEILIKDILSELIKNIFKYADKNQEISIHFYETEECLIIETNNTICECIAEEIKKDSKKKGLNDKILDKLNKFVGFENSSIITSTQNTIFNTKVFFSKNIFMTNNNN